MSADLDWGQICEDFLPWLRHLLDAPFCADCPKFRVSQVTLCDADEVCHQRAAFSPERPLMMAG